MLCFSRGAVRRLVSHYVFHVLVAASREVDEKKRVLRKRRSALDRLRERMARLKRRDYALEDAQRVKRGYRLVVVYDGVFGAARVVEMAVFRADARVVQPGGDGLRVDDVPDVRLEKHGLSTMEDAKASAVD